MQARLRPRGARGLLEAGTSRCSIPANPGRRVGAQVASLQSLILRSSATSIAARNINPRECLHEILDTAKD